MGNTTSTDFREFKGIVYNKSDERDVDMLYIEAELLKEEFNISTIIDSILDYNLNLYWSYVYHRHMPDEKGYTAFDLCYAPDDISGIILYSKHCSFDDVVNGLLVSPSSYNRKIYSDSKDIKITIGEFIDVVLEPKSKKARGRKAC